MRASDFEACSILMPKIDAEICLLNLSISQYPHSKDEFRKKLHKQLYMLANPRDPDAPTMEIGDLAKLLATGGRNG